MIETLAVLPFWELGPWELGPLTIHSFGMFVAIGLLVCFTMATIRGETKLGLSGEKIQNFGLYLVIIGWIFAHVINVIFYEPDKLIDNPLILFKVWGSISSYGGAFGGFIAYLIWRRRHPREDPWKWLDLAAWSLTFAWFFGRIGCASVHDHPGKLATDFGLWTWIKDLFGITSPEIWPLALDFSEATSAGLNALGGPRHDLGFYEALWWGVIVITFLILDRKPRTKGLYLPLLLVMYAPIRFLLDFLRIPDALGGDARYLGLTPAQYFSILIFLTGIALWFGKVRHHDKMQWETFTPNTPTPEQSKKKKNKKKN